jgi:hypothetical protein
MTKKSPSLDQEFEKELKILLKTFLKKHQDYGKGNILAIKELGIAMRITEKSQRLIHLLASNKKPDNESIDDSWTDIAVYAIIAKLYRDGRFKSLEVKD